MKRLIIVLLFVLLAIGALYATGIFDNATWWRSPSSTGKLTTASKTVDRQGAQDVALDLTMGGGRLRVKGGSSSLMNATFSSGNPAWQPDVTYNVSGTTGSLDIIQPDNNGISWNSSSRNDWDITLSNAVPMDLRCKIGAGDLNIDLSGTQARSMSLDLGAASSSIVAAPQTMTSMTVKAGVGRIVVDLSGTWAHSASVTVQGGVGSVELTVPKQTGVLLEVKHGLGAVSAPGFSGDGTSSHNSAYGTTPVTLTVHVDAGVGAVTVKEQ